MGGLQWWHIVIIIAAFVLLFGARKLPDAARGVGRSLRILKSEVSAMHEEDTKKPAPAENDASAAQATPAAQLAPAPVPTVQVPLPAQQPVAYQQAAQAPVQHQQPAQQPVAHQQPAQQPVVHEQPVVHQQPATPAVGYQQPVPAPAPQQLGYPPVQQAASDAVPVPHTEQYADPTRPAGS